ncbi:MAG TPA: PA14 domain-containing protein, partial [Chitinophagaceae bacterium]|nr:PA14 domain-containing protein [Chitinophagaceae bacterium]
KTTDADDAVGNHSKSYIRLNNPYFKKLGGGLRVKKVTIKDSWKILTSTDQGNTNGVPESEYGQEYDYTTTALVNGEETTISSGVAAYEPAVGAEENPFREILRYDDRQPLGPNERGAIELPLGEVFYPSPSVGYSKVTVRSIHRDNVKSGVGKNVSEFYTTKDFPTKSDHIDFDGNSHYRFKSNPILRLLKIDVREIVTLSQGFRLQTNDMDGKMHTQTSYDETGKQITYTENIYRIVKTGENKYAFNNLVPMITDPKNNIENLSMGKEIEVMTDFREHFTRAITFNLNFNVNTNLWGPYPIPVPSLVPPVHFAETGYRSASALKIVNTYGILEKVRHIDKGSEVSTKDLLYDAETGAVLATETNNEFNKPLYSFSYPAHWAYPEMQGASKNIGAVFEHVRFQNGKITTAGVDLNEFMKVFESGDELFVSDHSNAEVVDEPGCYPSGPPVTIPKSRDPDDNSKFVRKIWALNMNKDPDNTESKFLFIDKNGDPYSGADVTIKIIRSGKRNLVEASVGGFTSLANPLRTVGSDLKLIVDDETKIINTTANTFKEKWRVDEAFYTKDSIQTVVRLATVLPANVAVTQSAAFGEYRKKNKGVLSGFTRIYRLTPNPSYFIATQNNLGSHQEDYRIRSWVLFNFDNLPDLDGNSKIVSAEIHLPSHWDNHDIYVGEEYVHTNHSSLSPHYSQPGSPNDFVLSRMKSDWPSFSNVNAWRQKYDAAPPGGEENQLPVKGTAPERSNKDYNLDITKVVREMIKDKFDPSKNFATGIMINRLMESQRPPINVSRVCFDVNSWFFSNRKISIDLRYYNCTPDNPIVYIGPASGAPTIPPPGYAYCTADEVTTLCFSHFTRKRMNPYTKGVLGNWRADVGYVYYDNRRESDAAAVTEELSKGGVIATNYKSFWISPNTGDGIVINNDAINGTGGNPATWKWNSKVTQFNNKGFELENTDPLGRFNCGLYGYDKSLPVAVANNSKLRSAAFDGFEDYSYQSNNCAVFCKPQRHLVIDNAASHIVNTERHSGVSSLKLGPNESISAHANIITAAADALGYDINIQNLITTTTGTWVTPNGTGIQGHYFNFGPLSRNFLEGWKHFHERVRDEAADVLNSNTGFTSQNDPYVQKQSNGNFAFFLNPGIQPPPGIGNRPPTVNGYDYYCVRWEAWVQAPYSGVYTFRVISDDGMRVFVDGNLVNLGNYFINHGPMPADFTINCSIGVPHQIRIDYYEEEGASTSYLTWRKPGFTNFEVVPKDYLFLTEAGALAAVTTGTFTCEKPDIIQVKDNALTDVFSPIQGQKMVFSAWVKEGAAACQCDNYTSNQAQVFFDNSTTATFNFTPTGKIIEGWQRYEAVFDIPANATSMEVKLRSTGDKDVYWDDLRIHPFNANMKSFVYHPVTLRLMAEQDENNYSSFYEYDDDGTLIRVKKETERGIKTITETRSALQKKITE